MAYEPTAEAEAAFLKAAEKQLIPWWKPDLDEAATGFQTAIELDTNLPFNQARLKRTGYPRAWSHLAYTLIASLVDKLEADSVIDGRIADAMEFSDIALEVDNEDYDNHWAKGFVLVSTDEFPRAVNAFKDAQCMNAGKLDLETEISEVFTYIGDTQTALDRFNSFAPAEDWHRWDYAWIAYFAGIRVPPHGESGEVQKVLETYQNALNVLDKMKAKQGKHSWATPGVEPDERDFIFDTLLVRAAIHYRRAEYYAVLDPGLVATEETLMDKAFDAFMLRKQAWINRSWTLDDERFSIRKVGPRQGLHQFYSDGATREYWLDGCDGAGLT